MKEPDLDRWHMQRALELAERGQGFVEPNPMVGCVLWHDGAMVGDGWHGRFGGPHAEVEAISVAGKRAAGATLYVTLEPCCHQGKTPPCSEALIEAGIGRIVIAQRDPFPKVDGGGIRALQSAGLAVEVGILEAEAQRLNAPFLKLTKTARPWVIAKWAMTLDGKLATGAGDSKWISGEGSRAIVHELRGRVDAIVVGSRTAAIDDPLLTARPPGPRAATRVVVDSKATLPCDSQLVRTAGDVPVLVAAGSTAAEAKRRRLTDAGCEVFVCSGETHADRLVSLLEELGRRRMTNILVEGGGQLLGNLFDANLIDEVHVFLAPKIIGGADALSPVGGHGLHLANNALSVQDARIQVVEGDIYLCGRLSKPSRKCSESSSPSRTSSDAP